MTDQGGANISSEARKLNLGSGMFPKKGFINVDCEPSYTTDICCDLNQFPWPFPSSHFDVIEMDHVLEHLSDIRPTLNECVRILAPEGRLVIRVPHFSRGFTHWDHRRGFDFTFLYYFDPNISGGLHGIPLKGESCRFRWFGQPYFKRVYLGRFAYLMGQGLGFLFDFIGNINPFFTSRLFCYYVGGYDEIEFVFRLANNENATR